MKNRIKADIEKLHEEIQWLKDDKSRDVMDAVLADLEIQLAMADDEQSDIESQLEAAVTHFEVDHPAVAAILRNILAALGNMGI
ncbi:MAG TPA: DUF4404 family protein [Pseudomonadales bacterium]|jgi:hypothetical protein